MDVHLIIAIWKMPHEQSSLIHIVFVVLRLHHLLQTLLVLTCRRLRFLWTDVMPLKMLFHFRSNIPIRCRPLHLPNSPNHPRLSVSSPDPAREPELGLSTSPSCSRNVTSVGLTLLSILRRRFVVVSVVTGVDVL